jgi:pilus assembly protein CpaB
MLFGLLAAFIVRDQFAADVASAPAPETFVVPVASVDLTAGRQISLGDIAVLRLTNVQMRERGLTDSYMRNTQQIMGRILQQDLPRGSTFDTGMFYPEGTQPSVATRLQPGYRAVNISVEGKAAVAGFARAGSVVDILFRNELEENRSSDEDYTVTLLEAVEVLAFNRDTNQAVKRDDGTSGFEESASVTIAVTPEQAASLQIAEGRGSLSLALRHPDDLTRVLPVAPRTLNELLDRPVKQQHKMEIYRGNRLSHVMFEDQQRRDEVSERLVSDVVKNDIQTPQAVAQ